MKRLTCKITALAVLIGTCLPAMAEYFEALQLVSSLPFEVNVDNSGAGLTLITVRYVAEAGRGRTEEMAELLKVPAGQRVPMTLARPGKGVRLAIFEIDTNPGGVVGTEIKQGAHVVGMTCQATCRIVISVVD